VRVLPGFDKITDGELEGRRDDERRFVTLGLSDLGNLIVVVYTYRERDTIRVISAWKANKRPRVLYEKGRG